MAIVYGTDIAGLLDLPDPEVTVSEDAAGAYACARRWLTPDGCLTDIGETEPYDSIDVTEWMGASIDLNSPSVLNDLVTQATQVLYAEPYAKGGVQVTATYLGGVLTLTGNVQGAPGPFSLVVANGAAGVTAKLLLPGQTS
jgi:hypothetical protein